ncbi:MAG: HAD-IA family hydrolase, partial [Betaproteobacteria bacterium]|nr:HAD-IA family hydrolase [Betaproteobacteria bacterium]
RALEKFSGHYERCNGRSSVVFPGAREGLAAMRAAGLQLACVTNKAARFTGPLLAATGLDEYFAAVVTSDAVGRRKPDPAIFLHACAMLGVGASEGCVIGDSDNDAQGARAAGCRFLLVPYGYREGRDVRDIDADGIVPTLLDAAVLLVPGLAARWSAGTASGEQS